MKTKVLFILTIMFLISFHASAQRSIRIGYIDTEYILQNVPEYQEASAQLDDKVQKWKSEIEQRLSELDQKKNQLSNESVLLTKELIEERQEEIDIEESEILNYQQNRFGPNGDLMIQKKQLMQPIQDQIFIAVQEIATNRNYDFIFDKSADVVMLYSADRFDISEQVLRSITRSSNREQAQSRQERKAADEEELIPEINVEQEAREKALADKTAEREKAVEDRRNKILEDRDAKKQALEDKKKKILEDRAKAREDKLNDRNQATGESQNDLEEEVTEEAKTISDSNAVDETSEPKLSVADARKKVLEDKKKKILEDRAKALEEKTGSDEETTKEKVSLPTVEEGDLEELKTVNDSTAVEEKTTPPLTEKEARKKALEEKKKKILADRKARLDAAKKEKDSTSNNN